MEYIFGVSINELPVSDFNIDDMDTYFGMLWLTYNCKYALEIGGDSKNYRKVLIDFYNNCHYKHLIEEEHTIKFFLNKGYLNNTLSHGDIVKVDVLSSNLDILYKVVTDPLFIPVSATSYCIFNIILRFYDTHFFGDYIMYLFKTNSYHLNNVLYNNFDQYVEDTNIRENIICRIITSIELCT